MGLGQGAVVTPRGAGPAPVSLTQPESTVSADVSGYSSSLREALVPLVADHKCSSPEVYGADISPNMLCAGYFDCRSDACQVSWDSLPLSCSEPRGTGPVGPAWSQGRKPTFQLVAIPPEWVLTAVGGHLVTAGGPARRDWE